MSGRKISDFATRIRRQASTRINLSILESEGPHELQECLMCLQIESLHRQRGDRQMCECEFLLSGFCIWGRSLGNTELAS
jgi:hypothetical protein